jgi:hypothetical protein
VCTASTPVGLTEASKLVDLLVDALRDTASSGRVETSTSGIAARPTGALLRMVRRLRPGLASISAFPMDLYRARASGAGQTPLPEGRNRDTS